MIHRLQFLIEWIVTSGTKRRHNTPDTFAEFRAVAEFEEFLKVRKLDVKKALEGLVGKDSRFKTYTKLADALGVTARAIRYWRSGKRTPNKASVAKLQRFIAGLVNRKQFFGDVLVKNPFRTDMEQVRQEARNLINEFPSIVNALEKGSTDSIEAEEDDVIDRDEAERLNKGIWRHVMIRSNSGIVEYGGYAGEPLRRL